ncbi:hypothetical protein A4G19_08900 [Pasteurellaceae bacterium Macca]|nr:hypothetical protein [Pasteurellaceae bacterium Macca]
MNKMTKVSAIALVALFLSACDKPTTNGSTTGKTETIQTAQLSAEEIHAQGVADLEKLLDWNEKNKSALIETQSMLEKETKSGDYVRIQHAFQEMREKIALFSKALDQIEIKNNDVNVFKHKLQESLTLSNEMLLEYNKAVGVKDPSPELKASLKEKAEKLLQSGKESQQLLTELEKKFGKNK